MPRRALTMLALAAMLFMASGAGAQVPNAANAFIKKVIFERVSIDTANYLNGAAATLNDTLVFTSAAFGVSKDWTRCVARIMRIAADSIILMDSVGFELQSKMDTPYDTLWWTLATMTKKSVPALGTAVLLSTVRAYSDADTVGQADLYRVRLHYVIAPDTLRNHDTVGIVRLTARYLIYLIFNHRGNE